MIRHVGTVLGCLLYSVFALAGLAAFFAVGLLIQRIGNPFLEWWWGLMSGG